jgi:phosphatidylserine decarboxylase
MDTYPESTREVIGKLKRRLEEDRDLAGLLESSLRQARSRAEETLSKGLFLALMRIEGHEVGWPTDIGGYIEFLHLFARWTPRQSKDPAWLEPGTEEHQEVYDRLCHFYWLIDQKVEPGGKIVENDEWFSKWLVEYANVWGDYLNTTESFNDEVLKSFMEESPMYRIEDSMVDGRPNNPSGWLTFNQFFARELNPGLRPISSPADNTVITSPADCTFRKKYSIGANSEIDKIVVKGTHKFANVKDLLVDSPYADQFANGTFVHYFLGPYSYHRFHTPAAGLLRECRKVQGLVYLDVNISGDQFDAPDSSQGGYEFNQARGIVMLDTSCSPNGDVGLVAVVPIGMCQVSSVNMTAVVGNNMDKGEEFGYFLFGGSDIIVLFQEGVNPDILTSSQYRHYGTTIATCRKR